MRLSKRSSNRTFSLIHDILNDIDLGYPERISDFQAYHYTPDYIVVKIEVQFFTTNLEKSRAFLGEGMKFLYLISSP